MRLFLLTLFTAAGLLLAGPLPAQTPPPPASPWTPDKQFSADATITLKNGMTVASKVNVDDGKIRSAASLNGMDMVAIVRLDEKKMFTIMEAQKIVMEMELSPAMMKQYEALTAGEGFKFELVGPELVGTTPCLKYKVTLDQGGKTYFRWIDATTKTPVKVAAGDGSVVATVANYKVGPQDPALFEPPTDGYQTMQMPGRMGAPGGAAGPGPGTPSAAPAPGNGPTSP